MAHGDLRLRGGAGTYSAQVVNVVEGVPVFSLARVEEHKDGSYSAVTAVAGSFAALALELADASDALEAAWQDYCAGPSLPEPVGNAA